MKSGRCPYLGLKEDPRTALDFPSVGNKCHRAAGSGAVNPGYQKSTCLSGQHTGCPVYMGKAGRPLPKPIRAAQLPIWMDRRSMAIVGLPLILLLLAGLVIALIGSRGWLRPSDLLVSGQAGDVQEVTGFNLLSPTLETTAEPGQIPVTSNQQGIPTTCPIPENWVPYEILPTDSLHRLSVVFGVPTEVLQAENCLGEEMALIPGQILYVPYTITGPLSPSLTPTDLPAAVMITPPAFAEVPAQPTLPVRDANPPAAAHPTDVPAIIVPPTNVPATSVPPTDVPPTGTDVPQPIATNPPPPVEPPPPDDTVPDNNGIGNNKCVGDSITVSGNDQILSFTGICTLTVTGNNNHITVPTGTKVKDKGNGNVIVEL